MAPAHALLWCDVCANVVHRLDVNTLHLAAELCKARKAHCIKVHGWTEAKTG